VIAKSRVKSRVGLAIIVIEGQKKGYREENGERREFGERIGHEEGRELRGKIKKIPADID